MGQDKNTNTNTALSKNIQVNITNKDKQKQDIANISTDTKSSHYKLHEVNKEVLNIRKDVAGEVGAAAFEAIGDIYDSDKYPALRDAIPKEVFQALAGAAMATISGSGTALSGAASSIAAEKAADAIMKISKDGKVNKEQMKMAAIIAGALVGGATGGSGISSLGGANIAQTNIENNFIPHLMAILWIADKVDLVYEAYIDQQRIKNGEITKEDLIKEKGAEYVASAIFGKVGTYGAKYIKKIIEAVDGFVKPNGQLVAVNGKEQTPDVYTSSGNSGSGGAYKDMKKPVNDGKDAHHIPDRKADDKVSVNDGMAVKMDKQDHINTSSHGSDKKATKYRTETRQMIEEERIRDAVAREVRDARNAAQKGSGDRKKYNQGLQEMIQYGKENGQIPPKE